MAEEKEVPLHLKRLGLLNKDEQSLLLERKKKQLFRDMAATFTSMEGRRSLRYLLDLCGYKKSKVGGNPTLGMDVMAGTLYNSAREQVAIEFLEFIPADIRRDCEFGTFNELEE